MKMEEKSSLEETINFFGLFPFLMNVADIIKNRPKRGAYQAGMDGIASEKILKLVKELEIDEKMVLSIVNSLYKIHGKGEGL